MTELFYIDERKQVRPYPETLLIEPFKKIWERNEDKDVSLKELAYVWASVSPSKKNPFRGIPDDMKDEIRKFVGLPDGWKPDDDIKNAEYFLDKSYKELWNVYATWKDTNNIINKLRRFLNTIDLNERTEKGYLVHKPGDIAIAAERLARNDKILKELEDTMFSEMEKTTKKTYSPAANPDFFKDI